MKSGRMVRGTLALLLATLLIVDGLAAVQPAEAGEFLNFLVGGMRVINALNRRNRTYRAARDTQRDFNVYYDSLTDTAHDQLLSGDLQSLREGEEGLERVRLAAFIRLSAALQAEQAAVTQAIEAEKNQARVEFNRSLVRQLQSIITQLPGAQRVLSDVRDTISHIRSTVIAIQTAAAANQPLEPLAQQLAEQVAFSAELQQGVRSLGSALGVELDHILGGALSQVEAALGDIKQEVNQTVELLDTMDTQLDQVYLTPTELEISEIDIGPANVQLTDRATAVIDVASQALAFLSAAQGTGGTTRQQLYQQIRADLLEGHNQALLNAVQHVSQVDCTAVGKGEYEAAAGMLGVAPGAAGDPEKARYMVCTDRETGYVIRAWIVEGGPTPTPEANVTATVTHEPQPTAVQGTPATVASCDAMSYLTFSSIYYDNYVDTGTCVAVIDATNLSETTPVIYTLRWTDGQLRNRPLPPQQKGTVELIYTGNFETIFLEWVVARFDTGPCNELFANVSDEEMSGTRLQVYTSDVTTCDWWAGSRP